MMFRKGNPNPYDSRTKTIASKDVVRDPAGAVKEAIWTLVRSNCYPPLTATYSSKAAKGASVKDVTVQTFYVEYPGGSELVSALGRLDEETLSREVLDEMIKSEAPSYEAYLIDKIGADEWEIAKSNEAANPQFGRVEAAYNSRIVEVFLLARADDLTGKEVRVVGRESLAVERSRLQKKQGREPNVIAVVKAGAGATTNPHLREYLGSAERRYNRPIYILEGRNAREFIIGSHPYDDIRVRHMPENEWWVLRVFCSGGYAMEAVMSRVNGDQVITVAPQNNRKWMLASPEGSSKSWVCDITLTPLTPKPISDYPDAQEVPPSIQINGRVLPRTSLSRTFMPDALLPRVRGLNATSGITLKDNVFLFAANDDRDVYLLSLDDQEDVEVNDANGNQINRGLYGYPLTDGAQVSVGESRYRWEAQDTNDLFLPPEIVGLLRDHRAPKEWLSEILDTAGEASEWIIGNWRRSVSAADTATPILIQNPDPLLAHSGNLIFKLSGRDGQGRPIITIALRKVTDELPLLVKISREWQAVSWPDFGDQSVVDIPNVQFIGEGLSLIFGTTYYGIKTSGTLRS